MGFCWVVLWDILRILREWFELKDWVIRGFLLIGFGLVFLLMGKGYEMKGYG